MFTRHRRRCDAAIGKEHASALNKEGADVDRRGALARLKTSRLQHADAFAGWQVGTPMSKSSFIASHTISFVVTGLLILPVPLLSGLICQSRKWLDEFKFTAEYATLR